MKFWNGSTRHQLTNHGRLMAANRQTLENGRMVTIVIQAKIYSAACGAVDGYLHHRWNC